MESTAKLVFGSPLPESTCQDMTPVEAAADGKDGRAGLAFSGDSLSGRVDVYLVAGPSWEASAPGPSGVGLPNVLPPVEMEWIRAIEAAAKRLGAEASPPRWWLIVCQ